MLTQLEDFRAYWNEQEGCTGGAEEKVNEQDLDLSS